MRLKSVRTDKRKHTLTVRVQMGIAAEKYGFFIYSTASADESMRITGKKNMALTYYAYVKVLFFCGRCNGRIGGDQCVGTDRTGRTAGITLVG